MIKDKDTSLDEDRLMKQQDNEKRKRIVENEKNELKIKKMRKKENKLKSKINKKLVKTAGICITGYSTASAITAAAVTSALSGPAAPVVATIAIVGVLGVTAKFMVEEINKMDKINDNIKTNKRQVKQLSSIYFSDSKDLK